MQWRGSWDGISQSEQGVVPNVFTIVNQAFVLFKET